MITQNKQNLQRCVKMNHDQGEQKGNKLIRDADIVCYFILIDFAAISHGISSYDESWSIWR